ncbi:OmpA family protein [uncultured Polaribacter sp.]|uniref:OmpA family protein n=1 Tax=uncultured Polaribacter sp. TaxID=174711 RepID=UPI0026034341|nr:OmpA family protein [uncultured Polaribacter sp.]
MNKNILLTFFTLFIITIFPSQAQEDTSSKDKIDLDNSNSWAVGAGASNFIMHGDLRSIGTHDDTNYWNFGFYAHVDKMFNPLLGLELKANYYKMTGGAQSFTDLTNHRISYADDIQNPLNLNFEGEGFGAELNLIFSFTNLYQREPTKWNITGYAGIGYHQYNSALFEFRDGGATNYKFPGADFGFNPNRNSVNFASSIYLTGQIGLKRRISQRIDLELRTGMYFNNEDHLDAAISSKQDWETFFLTSIGLVVKLGKKKTFTIWNNEKTEAFKVIDTDKDGVMDNLDIEPNTPAGVMVYGNGKAIDTDKDGIPNYKDKCPFKYGLVSDEGCPIKEESDEKEIASTKNTTPTSLNNQNNNLPAEKVIIMDNYERTSISEKIALLSTSIYFDTNSNKIKDVSYANIDKIIELIKKVPNVNFVIEGHTDNTNSEKYNLLLSQKRVITIKNYMVNNGVATDRLKCFGYGESRPKYSNWNSGGRQLNRRVEIKPIGSFD